MGRHFTARPRPMPVKLRSWLSLKRAAVSLASAALACVGRVGRRSAHARQRPGLDDRRRVRAAGRQARRRVPLVPGGRARVARRCRHGRTRDPHCPARRRSGAGGAGAGALATARARFAGAAGRPKRPCPCAVATWRRRGDSSKPCCANGSDDGWRYALAALGGGSKDPAVTADLLQQLVDAKAIPNVLQAWLAFGGLAQKLDQQALAERIVDEVVVRFPNEPRVALLRASQLRESGKVAEARKCPGRAGCREQAEPGHAACRRRRIRRTGRCANGRRRAVPRSAGQPELQLARIPARQGRRHGRPAAAVRTTAARFLQARSGTTPAARPDRRIPQAHGRSAGVVSRRSRRPATLAGAPARGERAARTQARRRSLRRSAQAAGRCFRRSRRASRRLPARSRPAPGGRRSEAAKWTRSRAGWRRIRTTARCCMRVR